MKAEVGGIYIPKNKTGVKGGIINWFVVEYVYPIEDCIIIGDKGQKAYVSRRFIADSIKLEASPLIGHSISERIDAFLNIYKL